MRARWLVVFAASCTVGPRYRRPDVVTPVVFKEGTPAAYQGMPAGTWQPARPQDGALKGRWWEMFREPELTALEDQLDVDNQTIAQSFESFMAARAQVAEARAGYFPTISVAPAYNHTSAGGTVSGTYAVAGTGAPSSTVAAHAIDTFSLAADASWAPDLWGRVRNAVRQYRAAAQVSAADLENQRLTEQATLAQYYFQLRGQDALKDLYDRTMAADRQSLELTQARSQTGVGPEENVAQAQVTLANAEAAAVGVAVNRAVYEHAIATLIGKPASSFALPMRPLTTSAPAIPIGIPSELLQRRPDIAAAERLAAEANALIGVATAAYYPTLSLTTSGGVASTALGTLFSAPTLFWSLGVSASEVVFEGGLRHATVAQYEAMYRADVAAYRQVVLTAFQQVEDGLSSLRILSQQIAKQQRAVNAARRYLEIAQAAYETGINQYLDVITAQTTLLGDEQTLVTLRVNEMTAAVQLVQALGGGWELAKLPTPEETTTDAGIRKVAPP